MKHFLKSILAVILLTYVVSNNVFAEQSVSPHKLIEQTAEEVLNVLKNDEVYIKANPNRINDLVDEIILPICDVERMGKYILAKHWKTATDIQKQAFITEFQQLLIRTYGKHIVEYTNAEVTVLPEKRVEEKLYQTVSTKLDARNGIKPLQVDYVFRVDDVSSKIVDVRMEGMSILRTYRTAFTKEISETSLDQLIARIKLSNQPSFAYNTAR